MKRSFADRRTPWILAALAALLLLAAWLGLSHRATLLGWLGASQAVLVGWANAWPVLAGLVYLAVVTVGKVTPFPGGLILLLTAGVLFGPWAGAVLAAAGSAFSAGLVAAVGRRLLFVPIHRRWGERLAPIEGPVTEDGFNYILAARLFPVVPAWLVNMVPVVFPIPLRTVMLATFLGLLPVSFILANVGHQLANLAQIDDVAEQTVLNPGLLAALAALALLALGPAVYKRLRRR